MCAQAYEYLLRKCRVPRHKVVVMGDSAGGGLSLSFLLHLVDKLLAKGARQGFESDVDRALLTQFSLDQEWTSCRGVRCCSRRG